MNKKIKRKGFTLIELLAAVVLLGLLITGAIIGVSKLIKKSKENYYVKQKELVVQAGREYFNDNKNQLPVVINKEKCVTLETLITNKYISEVDYKKDGCSTDKTVVCARKETTTKYSYSAKLECENIPAAGETETYNIPRITFSGDVSPGKNKRPTVKFKIDYSDTSNPNKNPDLSSYTYVIYKQKGSGQNQNVDTPVDQGNNSKLSGKSYGPAKIKQFDTISDGTYYIIVNATNKRGKTVSQASRSFTIETGLVCDKDIKLIPNGFETTIDSNNKWIGIKDGNKIVTVEVADTVNKTTIKLKKNNTLVDTKEEIGNGIITYQLPNEDGIYEYTAEIENSSGEKCSISAIYKVDKTEPICTVTSTAEGWTNKEVKLTRSCSDTMSGCIDEDYSASDSYDTDTWLDLYYTAQSVKDNAGNEGTCEPKRVQIDHIPPTCQMTATGITGDNNWFTSDVNITVDARSDNITNPNDIKYAVTEEATAPANINNTDVTLNLDTKGKIYHGFVEDEAGNVAECESTLTVKRDTVDPTCEITADGIQQDNKFIENVILNSTFNDGTSTINNKGLSISNTPDYNNLTTITHTEDTEGTTYHCYAKDKAGHTGTNELTIVKEEIEPSCEIEITSGTLGDNDYYTSNVGLRLIPTNAASYGFTTSNTATYNSKTTETLSSDTEGTTYYGYVKTANGKTATCQKTIKRYTAPATCDVLVGGDKEVENNPYYTSDVRVMLLNGTDITQYGLSNENVEGYNGTLTELITEDTEGTTYYGFVKNKAGLTGTCEASFKRYEPAPTCSVDVVSGTLGENDYYTSDVRIGLTKSDDVVQYGGSKNNSTAVYNSAGTATVTANTEGVIYYGFVKGKNGKETTCEREIKRYDSPPKCRITPSGTLDSNGYYTSNVSLALEKTANSTSYGITTSQTPTYNSEATAILSSDTEGTTYYGYVKNKSGQTANCNKTIKRKSLEPSCSIEVVNGTLGENGYYTSNVELEMTTSNEDEYGMSTTNSPTYNTTSSVEVTEDTDGTTYYGYVKSADGKTGTCQTTIKKLATAPTCNIVVSGEKEEQNNDYYTSDVGLTLNTSANALHYGLTLSPREEYSGILTEQIEEDTEGTTYYGYVKNIAGLKGTCQTTVKKYTGVPACNIDITDGTLGENDYYITDVDLKLNTENATSYGFTTAGTALYNSQTTATITENTDGTTYYGYVKAKNAKTATCEQTIKKYDNAPTCSVNVTSGTLQPNGYYSTIVELALNKSSNSEKYGLASSNAEVYNSSESVTLNTNTDGITYYGYVKNKSGQKANCSKTVKIDIPSPTCSIDVTSGTLGENDYYTSNVGITMTTANAAQYGMSSTNSETYNSKKTATLSYDTDGVTVYGFVKSETGETATCQKTIKRYTQPATCDVLVSGDKEVSSNPYYTSDVGVILNYPSGITQYGLSKINSENYNSVLNDIVTEDTEGTTYYGFVKNKAGVTGTCQSTIKRYAPAPTCSIDVVSGTLGENEYYTTNVGIKLTKSDDVVLYGGSTTNTVKYNSQDSATISSNTEGMTFYGFVKGKNAKTATCEREIKVYNNPPQCRITPTGTLDSNGYYTSNVDLLLEKTDNSILYGLTTVAAETYNSEISTQLSTDTEGKTYYGFVKNKSGQKANCSKTIKRKTVEPSCSIDVVSGTEGENGYYTSNVEVAMTTSNADQYGMSETNSAVYNGTTSATITSNTEGKTYYGFVKTSSGKTATCQTTIKRYHSTPSCQVSASGTLGTNDYYTSDVEISLNRSNNSTAFGLTPSSVTTYNSKAELTRTTDTEGLTYHGYVKNKSGETGECSTTIKRFTKTPTCTIVPSGTKGLNDWYTSDVDLTLNTTNASSYNLSKSSTASYAGTTTLTQTAVTTGQKYYGYVKSKSGMTGSCNKTVKKSSAPTCNFGIKSGTEGSNNWYKSDVTVGFTNVSPGTSGLASAPYSISTSTIKNYGTAQNAVQSDTQSVTYYGYVKNNAGQETLCGTSIFKVDTTPPVIEVKSTRCISQTYGTGGASSGTTNSGLSTSNGILDSNNCKYKQASTGSIDSSGNYVNNIEISDLNWNPAGITYSWRITDKNISTRKWMVNTAGTYNSLPALVPSTETNISSSGTKQVNGATTSSSTAGRRQGKITAIDEAGNTSTALLKVNIAGNIKVNFNVNGGNTWTSSTCNNGLSLSSGACSKMVTYHYNYGYLPTPTKSGDYIFNGWYTAASGGSRVSEGDIMTSTSTVTLYAHWKYNKSGCEPKNNTWSSDNGDIRITSTYPATLQYKKLTTSSPSLNSGFSTLGSNKTSAETSNLKHFKYLYRIGTDGNGMECYSKFDNLKPYTQNVGDFYGADSHTLVNSVKCYTGSGSLINVVGEFEDVLVDKTCDVSATVYNSNNGIVGWSSLSGDQPETNGSGSSGIKYVIYKHYYENGTTCETKEENGSRTVICPDGFYKYTAILTDYAGNNSSKLTVNFDYNFQW